MTTLQAIQVVASYMQVYLIAKKPYGVLGEPNMGSIIDLANLNDADATKVIRSDERMLRLARAMGFLP